MKRELLAATALSTAVLVDLPAARAEPYDWQGTYIGGVAGYAGLGTSTARLLPLGDGTTYDYSLAGGVPTGPFPFISFPAFPLMARLGADGGSLGVEVGHNWQSGHLVYGAEGDFSALFLTANVSGSQNAPAPFGGAGVFTTAYNVSTGLDWLSTLRGRIGYTQDRLLIFATGGLAVGETHLSTSLGFQSSDGTKGAFLTGSRNDVRVGYVLGGGVEYAIDNHLSVKLEGLYYDLGHQTVIANGSGVAFFGPATVQPYAVAYRFDGVLGRLGLNYRF